MRRGVAVRGLVGGVVDNDGVTETAQDRKARGAFFTPDAITTYLTQWAVRSDEERIFEPSAGDAAFLVAAIRDAMYRKLSPCAQPTSSSVRVG